MQLPHLDISVVTLNRNDHIAKLQPKINEDLKASPELVLFKYDKVQVRKTIFRMPLHLEITIVTECK